MIVEHLEPQLEEVVIVQYEGDYDEDTNEYHGAGFARLDNECTYEGTFRFGLFHGKGKFVWPNGVVYEGDFASNNITGSGTYTYPDSSVYTGQVLNGKRHGQGKLVNSLNQWYEGEWQHGQRHGIGKMAYNEEATNLYHGDWKDNLRHGYGIMKYPSGNSYEGEWQIDQKNGFGVMIWKDLDEVFTGNWYADKPHGYGEHIWGESTSKTVKKQHCNLYRGEFQDGKRHGKGVFFYMNGSQYSGYWEGDLKHGAGIFIHPDGLITGGDYELNRMITFSLPTSPVNPATTNTNNNMSGKSGSSSSSSSRSTEDISPQYHLNIEDVFMTYPIPIRDRKPTLPEKQQQRMKSLQEITRVLLKYNQFIKSLLKRYHDYSNRQRQREIIAELPPQHVGGGQEDDRSWRLKRATLNARQIVKRFHCCTLEQVIRCFRELDIVGSYLNAYDLTKILQDMRRQHLLVAKREYRAYIEAHFINNPNEENEDAEGAAAAPMLAAAADGSNQQDDSNNEANAQQVARQQQQADELRRMQLEAQIEEILQQANVSIGRLLDDYQDDTAADAYFYWTAHQPVLEHEFIELFVRAIAEVQSRKGVTAQYMTLPQAVEKVLAQKLLPALKETEETGSGSLFYRAFYVEKVQDLLRSRPNAAADTHALQLEAIWNVLKRETVETMFTFVKNSGELIPAGGYCKVSNFVNWMLTQQGVLIADGVTANELLETCMTLTSVKGRKDYTAMERRMHYEDFLEFVVRIVTSIYWVHGQQQPVKAMPAAVEGEDAADGSSSIAAAETKDMHISESGGSLQQESTLSLGSSEMGAVDMCTRLGAWFDTAKTV